MFENNDVVISGYEIAFKDASDNDLYVIGVPRCEASEQEMVSVSILL